MQINELQFRLERLGVSSRILHLRVGAYDVDFALNKAATDVRKDKDVPGFRKGKAPLKRVLAAHYRQVTSKAFNELWSAGLRQVFKQLEDIDQPLIPPELDGDEDKWPRPAFGEMLDFSVSYVVDPMRVADAMDPSKQQDRDPLMDLQPRLPYHGAPRMQGPAGPPDIGPSMGQGLPQPADPIGSSD